MNGIFFLILFCALLRDGEAKVTNGTFTVEQLYSHQHFYYLGKMDYGIGQGTLDAEISYYD